mgnify:CR=1 FL=1
MIEQCLAEAMPGLTQEQTARFVRYYELLVEWNARVNLTAITDAHDVAQKHFADSVLPLLPLCAGLLPPHARCVDVGTGAGFPGVPLMIMRPDLNMTLLDSLNKRLVFLDTLLKELGMSAELVHARAEDAGRDPLRRERYDIALARAVAGTAALAEWTLPLLKVRGKALLYKGPKAEEELSSAAGALRLLHGEGRVIRCDAPWGERHITVLTKTAPTPKAYPRKAGTAVKNPLP